jgi:hypothetical protein
VRHLVSRKIACCSGNSLEPQLPSMSGKPAYGREKNSGMVIMLRIGQSAWLQPNDVLLVNGWPTETDPLLLDNEDLSSLNPVKIQSKLPQKCGRRRWAGVALNYCLLINYLLVSLIKNSAEKYYAVSNQAMLTGPSF